MRAKRLLRGLGMCVCQDGSQRDMNIQDSHTEPVSFSPTSTSKNYSLDWVDHGRCAWCVLSTQSTTWLWKRRARLGEGRLQTGRKLTEVVALDPGSMQVAGHRTRDLSGDPGQNRC